MVYSGNPATTALDAIRFWIQDTSSTPLFSDDELRYLITVTGGYTDDPLLQAALLCMPLSARFAGKGSISADGVSLSYAELAQKYRDLAAQLEATWVKIHGNRAFPYAGGVERCEPSDASVRPHLFAVGQFDVPGSGQIGGYEDPNDPGNYQTG